MGHQMITAPMLTKSWDAVHAKYGTPKAQIRPAYVEEGIANLDEGEVMLEKQALSYDAVFLRCMVAQSLDTVQGQTDTDSDTDCDTEVAGSRIMDEYLIRKENSLSLVSLETVLPLETRSEERDLRWKWDEALSADSREEFNKQYLEIQKLTEELKAQATSLREQQQAHTIAFEEAKKAYEDLTTLQEQVKVEIAAQKGQAEGQQEAVQTPTATVCIATPVGRPLQNTQGGNRKNHRGSDSRIRDKEYEGSDLEISDDKEEEDGSDDEQEDYILKKRLLNMLKLRLGRRSCY
ncbi:hypothetical protein BGX38DRAFT_1274852 [Terfezia claveryi]|nr:hypothetical protein BGX38DRAFT_1274852 [Terfezia claveryi]